MSPRRFELKEGTSSKFWEVSVSGSEVHTRYGKIGSEGRLAVKDAGSSEAAAAQAAALVREKLGKGYVERSEGPKAAGGAPTTTAPVDHASATEANALVAAPATATKPKSRAAPTQKRPKPPKGPAGGTPEYRACAERWSTIVDSLKGHNIEAFSLDQYMSAFDAALADAECAGVAAPEAVLDRIASLDAANAWGQVITDPETVQRLFGEDPAMLAEQQARQVRLRA